MAINGSSVLISVLTSTGPDVFSVIPCQVSGEYSLSVEAMDTSCKDSPDAQNLPGSRERTISVETMPSAWPELNISPAGVEQIIRDAAETGTQVDGRIVVGGAAVEEFTATITSYSLSAGREEAVTLSMELQISGALAPVAA